MNATVHQFHFTPGTLIAYDGFQVVVTGAVKGGIVVRDRFIGEDEIVKHFVLSDARVNELLQRLDVHFDSEFSSDDPDQAEPQDEQVAFENRPRDELERAYQKEAFCLAAKSVLKRGPFFPGLITKNLTEITTLALDRQKLNGLGTTKNGAFVARTWGARSISNFCNLYFAMPIPHPKVLLDKTPTKKTRRQLTAAQCWLLDKCCDAYLSSAQPSGASIVRYVNRRFRKVEAERRAAGDFSPFNAPHMNTIYRRLRRFSRLELVIAREGYRAAQKEFSPTQHGVRALKPGEMIELDFWKGDVFTFSEESKFWDMLTPDLQKVLKDGKKKGKKKERQRIWICVALDVATRMVLGMGMAESPNERTVIEVLDMVMRDKSDISSLAGCKMPWSQHCGLGTVIFDTGSEFFNDAVQNAILAAGGSFILGRAAVPMDKPFVERFFGGVRTLFADELPGKTGFSPSCLVNYDKEGMAAFNAEEFRLLLTQYIVDHYAQRENAGLFSKRPIDAWKDAQKYRCVAPPPLRVRRNATGLKLTRMLTKEGVRICGIPFGDPSLFPKHLRNGKIAVEVRVDPNDLREVTILLNGKQIHLANQRPDLGRHSIRTLMAAIKEMTASRPQDRSYYEYVLARYADGLAEKIRSGVKKHGLPSPEVTAEEIDWFENSFCLKLNLIQNPESAHSADAEDLFAGRSGRGIYSAEDIAAEQAAAPELTAEVLDAMASGDDEAMTELAEVEHPVSAPKKSHRQTSVKPATNKPSTKSHPGSGTGRVFTGAPKGKGKFT
jgi:Mu transposase, C-terminal